MVDEEDIQPAYLPEGVQDFVEDVKATIAENMDVDESLVIFSGFTMHFRVGGKDITFEDMKIA